MSDDSTPAGASATAPAADAPAVPASEASNEGRALNSVEDAVRALEELDAQAEPSEAAQEEGQEDSQDGVAQEGGQEGVTRDGASPQPEEPAQEEIKAPQSWGKNAKELFLKLPPELRREVAERETARERTLNQKLEESAHARQEADQLREYSQGKLQEAINQARAAIEAEFAQVDWLALQQKDPQLFVQLDGARKQRLQAVSEALRQNEILRRHSQHLERQRAERELKEEMQTTTLPRLKELFGAEFQPASFAAEAQEYLLGLGAPQEHVRSISRGYMVELIGKAMQYDKMRKAEATAKEKMAAAPRLMPGKTAPGADPASEKRQTAFNKFRKNPGSTEAAISYLAALDGD
jgi:hypothetical protein